MLRFLSKFLYRFYKFLFSQPKIRIDKLKFSQLPWRNSFA